MNEGTAQESAAGEKKPTVLYLYDVHRETYIASSHRKIPRDEGRAPRGIVIPQPFATEAQEAYEAFAAQRKKRRWAKGTGVTGLALAGILFLAYGGIMSLGLVTQPYAIPSALVVGLLMLIVASAGFILQAEFYDAPRREFHQSLRKKFHGEDFIVLRDDEGNLLDFSRLSEEEFVHLNDLALERRRGRESLRRWAEEERQLGQIIARATPETRKRTSHESRVSTVQSLRGAIELKRDEIDKLSAEIDKMTAERGSHE